MNVLTEALVMMTVVMMRVVMTKLVMVYTKELCLVCEC